ncbi:MAG: hypothetical protein R3D05_13025 [Dongiaceae bacterium]
MPDAHSSAGELGSAAPMPDEVRAYLARLLGRSEFEASERNRRFLSYVVEETLSGRADRIKAYSIALAAFGRGEDFDPLTDPIVRIEASRLRRSLEHYYLTSGKSDPIRIDIPKGSYAAYFAYRRESATKSVSKPSATPASDTKWMLYPPGRRTRTFVVGFLAAFALLIAGAVTFVLISHGKRSAQDAAVSRAPSILVMPFENTSADPNRSFIARGLTYDIVSQLTSFDDLFIFGSETGFNIAKSVEDEKSWQEVMPDYVLTGSVNSTESRLKVSAILADGSTGQYLWSSSVERDLSSTALLQVQTEIADQVAAAIAQPYGFVFTRKAREVAQKPAESLVAYECTVRFREYWRSYSDKDFGGVRTCLENTIAGDPSYALGQSSLALLYVDAYRFGFGRQQIAFDPLERADKLADRAIELEPDSVGGYLAKGMVLWFRHDVQRSLKVLRDGLRQHPHDADLLGELGFRLALLAKWDEAMPLVEEAYARNPGVTSGHHIATFLYAYMHGDYKAALAAALMVETPDVLYGPLARAMAYAQLGKPDKAREEIAHVLSINPDYANYAADDLAARNIDPAIIRAILAGLVKSGLDVRIPASGG